MPKSRPSKKEWEGRLGGFALGTFKFSTRQCPPKGSRHYVELNKIKKCPMQYTTTGRDVRGTKGMCMCTYHRKVSILNILNIGEFKYTVIYFALTEFQRLGGTLTKLGQRSYKGNLVFMGEINLMEIIYS